MRIATVTLNPAIDQTVRVDNFRTNTVNYAQTMQFDAGGKGVNVASALADAGYDVVATGFLGMENAAIFEQFFASKRIDDQFLRIEGSTRIGVKIVDEAKQQTTDINMPGLPPTKKAMEYLFSLIERLAVTCDWFVLSGTLPTGVAATTYAALISLLKVRGKQVVLDTSREALHHAVQAGPTIVKPNIDELRQLTGQPLPDTPALEVAARQLLGNGTRLVIISMGERGAMFVDPTTTLIALPPTVKVKSTVGAGDAMVAGIIAGQIQHLPLFDCARLATAFSLGAITRVSRNLPTAEVLEEYAQGVAIQTLASTPSEIQS